MSEEQAREYRRSIDEPEAFWADAAQGIDWSQPWKGVLDDSNPPFYRWFAGAELNTCFNAVDRHVEGGRGDQPALIYDSPVTGKKAVFCYSELLERVARTAGMLAGLGVGKGDRVIIYMPMVPEAVFAMLACARIGAVHSVVFGGFAAKELAKRIDDAKPKVIMTASCGIEPARVIEYKPLIDEAVELATHKHEVCVVLQREQSPGLLVEGRDYDWSALYERSGEVDCVAVAATDPLYILYTSGTTGVPKGVVRDNGGHAVAMRWSMENVYGAHPGDVFWAASDIGWVVGHSYIVYAPLLTGCTTVLYEGKPVGTPDAGAFWRMVEEYRINVLFTAPTAFRAIKKEDPDGKLIDRYDLSSLRALFLAGERGDPPTIEWAERHLRLPVVDHWWQTETGWAIAANCMGIEMLPVKHGSPTRAVPGYQLVCLDEGGAEVAPGESGTLAIRLPLPPGCFPTLWHNDTGYVHSYLEQFPGYYNTGDAGRIDEEGYVWVMSRTDDIINTAGHRLSTGGMEEILAAHPDVAECAVIGVADEMKGQVPVGLVVLNAGSERSESDVSGELVAMVRAKLGPVAAFKHAVVVNRLPKTRSGKVLRRTMRKIADGESYQVPATIDDPAALEEIARSLGRVGLPRR